MKYLLDTHTAIWSLANNSDINLSNTAKSIIADTSTQLFVSVVSAWEIAIKVSIGKLNYNGGVSAFINQLQDNDIKLIGVNESHIKHVESLPFVHKDPFDRILISTAKVEDMTILTADENIHKYDVMSVW